MTSYMTVAAVTKALLLRVTALRIVLSIILVIGASNLNMDSLVE